VRADRDTLQDLALALALFALAFWHFLAEVPFTEFHRDEARWLHRSYFLEELRYPESDLWRTDSLLTLGQPPLGNYLMGIGLLVQGRELRPNGFYDFRHNLAWNRARGNVPGPEDLEAGRRTNAFIGAITVLVVYLIGRRLANRVAGVVGALILIPHPLNVYLSTFAGSDALLVCLVALAGLVAIALADRPTWPKAILLGILLGLGGATKLSPILLSLPLAGLGLALVLYDLPNRLRKGAPGAQGAQGALDERTWGTRGTRGRVGGARRHSLSFSSVLLLLRPLRPRGPRRPLDRQRDLGWMLLTLPVVAFAAFVLVYPYLWPDPWGRTDRLFDFRTQEMEAQGEIWENTSVNGPFEAIDRVEGQLGVRTSTSRWLAAEVLKRFDRTWDKPDLDLKLGTLGLALLALWALMYGPRSRYALAILVIGGEAALILVGMQVDFDRYHLPILLAVVVGVGFLAGQLWHGVGLLAAALVARRPRRSRLTFAPAGAADIGGLSSLDIAAGTAAIRPAIRPEPSPADAWSLTAQAAPSRSRPLLLAVALGLGVLIGHSWAGLRALTRNGGSSREE
jgi:hypothetical protein